MNTAGGQSLLAQHGWWLASRASGLVALALVTVSVGIGLLMAGKVSRKPGLGPKLAAIHEHAAVAAIIAISVHGVTLLGDAWLNPGIAGIAIPFKMAYRPLWTGVGIVGGYLAALLGLSFYARRRIGARLWRKAHRFTVAVYVMAVVHTLGAGTDASTPWMRAWLVLTGVPIAVLFGLRLSHGLRSGRRRAGKQAPSPRPQERTLSPRRTAVLEEA
jgi:methionine sulfoxide reductase heme-binding subunit